MPQPTKKQTRKPSARWTLKQIANFAKIPTVRDRLEQLNLAVLLSERAIKVSSDEDGAPCPLSPKSAAREVLRLASFNAYILLSSLPDTTLNQHAPDPDQQHALDQIGGGR